MRTIKNILRVYRKVARVVECLTIVDIELIQQVDKVLKKPYAVLEQHNSQEE